MTDERKNLKVSQEWYNEHKPKKDALGLSWEDYAAGNASELFDELADEIGVRLDGNGDVSEEDLARAVAACIDYDRLADLTADKTTKRVVSQLRG